MNSLIQQDVKNQSQRDTALVYYCLADMRITLFKVSIICYNYNKVEAGWGEMWGESVFSSFCLDGNQNLFSRKMAKTKRKSRDSKQIKAFYEWQREKDSNPHIRSQSPLCYLYTIPLNAKSIIQSFCDLSRAWRTFL